MEQKSKEVDEEVAKLEAKYRVEEDIKRDDKDKKKGERQKKKEKEKAKIREKSNKITEGDIMKVLEILNPKMKPKVTDVRDMIWVPCVRRYFPHRRWTRTWIAASTSLSWSRCTADAAGTRSGWSRANFSIWSSSSCF